MRLITSDDILETYLKIYQRGFRYIFSKLTFSKTQRTKSTFNSFGYDSANYWIIPRVRQRWNKLISGDVDVSYENYIVEKYLQNRSNLSLLSLGSGVCSHEIIFAKQKCFASVKCVDFSEKILEKAKQYANEQGAFNMVFESTNVNSIEIPQNSYDIILFHSSLHHFKNIPILLKKVRDGLKSDGLLVINEYVGPNRLQISRRLLYETNRILKNVIPNQYRKRLFTNLSKRSVSGPGVLRMIITDPSEAVESSTIMPTINKLFDEVEVKPLGGDLLMWLFKDISHNFVNNTEEINRVLDQVFYLEDEYIRRNGSDFILGVYKVKKEIVQLL